MKDPPKYSLNKKCYTCNKLIKEGTICTECYKKLEDIVFNNSDIETVHCLRCNILIGFSDTSNKFLKYCNECFQKVILGK